MNMTQRKFKDNGKLEDEDDDDKKKVCQNGELQGVWRISVNMIYNIQIYHLFHINHIQVELKTE